MKRFVTAEFSRLWQAIAGAWLDLERNDGWAIASHIALNILLAMFPFLIFLTALASFLGSKELADTVVSLLFDAWPKSVAEPLAAETRRVLTGQRGDLLTIGGVLALFFASSGVEALRVGLNRAYRAREHRSMLNLRLQSLAFVLVGAVGLLAFALLIVLGPAAWEALIQYIPDLSGLRPSFNLVRFGGSGATLIIALLMAHLWLPAGSRPFWSVLPGIALTVTLWLAAGSGFGFYLAKFSTYASTYAGFAGAMIALVFLYFLALIFLFGAELNVALSQSRDRKPDSTPGGDQ